MAKGDYSNVKSDVVRRMLDFYDLSSEAEADNRKKGLAAIKFYRGVDQWDTKLYDFRTSANRPAESYNQIPKFIRQITNDIRQNKAQIKFVPNTDGSKEVAEIMEDLARAIQATSEAEVAYDTAGFNAVVNGWGYFRFITDYEDDKGFDQIIKIKWCPNSFKIYDDPYATQQDFSDRRKLIELEDIKLSDFNREYVKKGEHKYDKLDLQSIGDAAPDWATDSTIRIAEYWEVTDEKSQLWKHKTTGVITDEEPKNPKDYDVREVCKPKVMWYKCNGMEVLEEQEWPGVFIPYVRISGETVYENGQVYYNGAVEAMIPPQKLYNYAANSIIERVSSQPLAPYLAAVGQIDGELQKYWDDANTKNFAWLPYNPIDVNGQVIGPPQRQQTSADISSLVEVLQMAQQGFNEASGQFQASIGAPSNEKSGKAIIARQREGDVSTFHFPDNLARGQRFGGRILADLMPKIYDGSRIVRLLKEDKSDYEQPINQPMPDEKDDNGQPVTYDLTVGTYDVMVDTGPSYTTKRQEASDSQIQLFQAAPEALMPALPMIIRNFDWPQADKIADAVNRGLPPQLQEQPDQDTEIPPRVQAQMQQMSQMIQGLQGQLQAAGQALQQAQQELQSKQGDLQVKMADVQSGAQSDAMKADNDRLKLEIEQDQLAFERQKADYDAMIEEKKLELEGIKIMVTQIQPAIQALTTPQTPATLPDENNQAEVMQAEQRNQQGEVLLQQMQGLMEAVMSLTQSVNAPKTVIRDPQTGLINGIAPVM